MLIETLVNDNDGVIVYSRNIFNHEENFRMILRKDKTKAPRKLFLYDICGLINNKTAKNLVVYRLLTNQKDFFIQKSEFGCFIRTDEGTELIYPDPVYAVKELEAFTQERYIPGLKFRIQQAGFITSNIDEEIKFREVFNFDLNSLEAQAQNDTVFVEALLKDSISRRSVTKDEIRKNELKNLTDETETSVDDDQTEDISFSQLSGVVNKKKKIEDNKNSSIEIFKSSDSLKNYIKKKLSRKIILRFKRR
jgi:hypothetical protein